MKTTNRAAAKSIKSSILAAEARLTETDSVTEAKALRRKINALAAELRTLAA